MNQDPRSERGARIGTAMPACLIDGVGSEFPATILDLSASGFRLRSNEKLEVGEEIRLRCGKGDPQWARIMWVRSNEAGGLFLEGPGTPA